VADREQEGHVFTTMSPAGVLCNCGQYREHEVHVDPPGDYSDPADPELAAIATAVAHLECLDDTTQRRVLRYLAERYGIED